MALGKSLPCLSSLRGLSLSLGRTSVQDNTYAILSECIPRISNLEKLYLNFQNAMNCSEESFSKLSLGFPKLKNLTDLKLSFQCCMLSDEVLLTLAECLDCAKALRAVGIEFAYYGQFSISGVAKFRQKIYGLKHLKHVVINENPRTPVKTNQNLDLCLFILFFSLCFMAIKYYFRES